MLTVTVPRLASYLDSLKEQGGPGTTIVLVDPEHTEAAVAFIRARAAKATGDWRIEAPEDDPADFQGEARRRFEDSAYERARTPGRERTVYVTTGPFYVIPSIKGRLHCLDARGRTIPHPRAPKGLDEAHKPGAGDTLWHQDEPAR